jgi:hypothetical protein
LVMEPSLNNLAKTASWSAMLGAGATYVTF